jgi:exopolyphosphatase / guanosine-5'-triphosphate,3'-diphosphate pyrophosphatase
VRLLVSEVIDDRPTFVHTDKVMARIGQSLGDEGRIDDRKIGEVAGIVSRFVEDARRYGAREIRAIATSATREALNGDELAEHVLAASGVALEVIDGDEEARLAFVGALASLDEPQAGEIGVVDVGGGSTEIVVGSTADGASWSRSFRLGSGRLSDRFIAHDPPLPEEIAAIRAAIDATLPRAEDVPTPEYGIAVAGSATNLRRMVGPLLDGESLARALRLLTEGPSQQIARQFQIEPTRARLLPAGALIIEAAMQRLGTPLWVGRGGIRQGVVLDMVAAHR